MRKRDLGMIFLAAVAVFFSLQVEGDFSFREAWYHVSDDAYPIKHHAPRLSPPLVADLNGDGRPEVLLPTHDATIKLLQPPPAHLAATTLDNFREACLMAEISLLPSNVRVASGRRPVAMAVGAVDRSHMAAHVQKQVLVVVTSGWAVMCFDHNLNKLWEANLQHDFPHAARHPEVAISVSNYKHKFGDDGLIIVGGRMEMQHHSADLFDDFMTSEHSREGYHRSATEKQASKGSNGVDVHHFALYAFSGRTGKLRWSRKNENIRSQPSAASTMIPQHNHKLDVHALRSPHPVVYEWRQFRESVLSVLPHHWDRSEDTFLQLAHFKNAVNNMHKPREHNPPRKDDTNRLTIEKAADLAGSAKGKKSLNRLYVPNVVVAHEKEGIEAIHLASGRTLCKLHLTEGGLHADINGDGVLDHVQVASANGAGQTVVTGSMEGLKPCWAVATSGVPPEQLFNVSICQYNQYNLFHHTDFSKSFGRTFHPSGLEVATPILLQRDSSHKHRRGTLGDIIFLTSRGEVTSYSPSLLGHDVTRRWQLSTGATWSNLPSPSRMMENTVIPTFKAFSLQDYDPKQVIIASGDQEAVVISPSGSLLASVKLPAPPTHALILEDFSGDGMTDVILVTSGGVYGFVQTRQPAALFFVVLVGCLIVVIGVVFASLHLNSSNGGKRRSYR